MLFTRQHIEQREQNTLAPYAVKSGESAGRVFPETLSEFRTCFQRDRDRIIHSKAFRRLMEKTQVFTVGEGDHYRNRMSHSTECAQVSRGLARGLGLNEDLVEAIALAHDLGHTPFGHAGEHALNECMLEHGLHFEHNEQSLRIVERLEYMYPEFDGLNLSKEVLDGLLKHRTPFDQPKTVFKQSAHLEAQVVDLGDEVAYMSHDLDDGLRADMFALDDIVKLPIVARAYEAMTQHYGEVAKNMTPEILRARLSSSLMHFLVDDILEETGKRLAAHHIKTLEDVRAFDGILVQFSAQMRHDIDELRAFFMTHYYFSPKVSEQSQRGQNIIKQLFAFYIEYPEKLPENFQRFLKKEEAEKDREWEQATACAVVVKDYVAGMTDGFAEAQFRVYFSHVLP
ncbi:MAG: dNTP triphosphohydrolase [Candidatus Gracilibacteria bacterium]